MPSRSVRLSVRLSVRPFVTLVYSVETNTHIFKFFSPLGSHTILVFPVPNVMAIFRRGYIRSALQAR